MIGIEPSHISRSINGTREWKHDEMVAFATIVGVPFDEVVLAAGLALPTSEGRGMVPVVGLVDASAGYVPGKVDAPRRAPSPPEAPNGTVAARFKTPGTPAEAMDGWLVYFVDGVKRVPPEARGRLCVSWLGVNAIIGVLRAGYVRGTFNLQPWIPGAAMLENVQVERASPVLWIRTSSGA